jgi:hypothetical protein
MTLYDDTMPLPLPSCDSDYSADGETIEEELRNWRKNYHGVAFPL